MVMVYGLWFMVYGLWFMVYDLWLMVCESFREIGKGLWFMAYSFRFLVSGVWFMKPSLGFRVQNTLLLALLLIPLFSDLEHNEDSQGQNVAFALTIFR